MKKTFYLFMLVILCMSSLTLTSCSDDDDSSISWIVGKWNFTSIIYNSDGSQHYTESGIAEFYANGTALFYGDEEYTWNIKGDILTLVYKGAGGDDDIQTFKLTKEDDTFTITEIVEDGSRYEKTSFSRY